MSKLRHALFALALTAIPAVADSAPAAPAGAPQLSLPIACKPGQTCEVQNYVDRDPGPGAKDWRCGERTYQDHTGVDIRVPSLAVQRAGVDVLAAAPGVVSRLRDGVADVSVKVAGAAAISGQECGNGVVISHGGGWETQYCHLAKGSIRVKAGDRVAAGQPIARVGLSGNTEYPHLHLSVRHDGQLVDPFAPANATSCDPRAPTAGLWSAATAAQLPYQSGAVLNAGFADRALSNDDVEAGGLAAPQPTSPALVAYVRAIGLKAGDQPRLTLFGPDGGQMAESVSPPLDHDKAQWLLYVGKKRPAAGWPRGVYRARYEVIRSGGVTIVRDVRFTL
ncbi:M23 family metallopeptidase [Phenylobacterium aquaticum]|uniref:M23 family metallopeptidase n=1 Tax=Phenylobacterium aquaticum TaxID=1763816 RepID=UPI0023515B76|nr:M23 family metallopeptidase [Phenylobacterium aquaticum]